MGFYDKLQVNIASGVNPFEPLFGGLIPRREIITEPSAPALERHPAMPTRIPVRQSGMERVSGNMLNRNNMPTNGMNDSANPLATRNVVFDYTPQKLALEGKQLELENKRLTHETEKEERNYELASREQDRRERKDVDELDINKDKQEIEHRKQALDEWKARNPEGELKADENGRLHVVDKRSGQSFDTGLVVDHFNEKEKEDLRHKHNVDLENIRQKNRIDLARERQKDIKASDRISPSQQRVAEKDAASELLNDNNFAWLNKKGFITFSQDGRVVIDRSKANTPEINGTIDEFERQWKTKTDERLGKRLITTESKSTQAPSGRMVEMYHGRTGEKLQVPEEEIEDAKAAGAMTAEEYAAKNKPLQVDDGIELFYNAEGKVIGARNKKSSGKMKFEEQ